MTSFELRYVGATALPSRLSDFDLEHYFRLRQGDIDALRERFHSNRQAGAAILLLFLRGAGRTLDQVTTVPRSLLRYVGETLGVSTPTIASLRAMYQRSQTFYAHQLWAKEYLGLSDVTQEASDRLGIYLDAYANEVVSVDELVMAAEHWLYRHQFMIPGDRAVRDLARTCYDRVEKAILAKVIAEIPASTLFHCRQAVYQPRAGNAYTVLEGVCLISMQYTTIVKPSIRAGFEPIQLDIHL